jgi:hypothetical protein
VKIKLDTLSKQPLDNTYITPKNKKNKKLHPTIPCTKVNKNHKTTPNHLMTFNIPNPFEPLTTATFRVLSAASFKFYRNSNYFLLHYSNKFHNIFKLNAREKRGERETI